jgi:hypothetical protein
MSENESEIEPVGWLEEDGICFFPGPSARLPSEIRISSPDIGVLDLITGLVIKNPKGPGVITVPYNSIENEKDPLPAKIFGVVVDADIIKTMLAEDPDFIALKDPNGLTWINLDQWYQKFGTNGLALIAKMRLFWNKHGGGVQVTKPLGTPAVVYKKLGR